MYCEEWITDHWGDPIYDDGNVNYKFRSTNNWINDAIDPYEANTNIYTNSGLGTVFFAKTT